MISLVIILCSIMLIVFLIVSRISFYGEKEQDLDLDKDFKTQEHLFYETCSICGKKLKHARFGKKGDVMRCTVECRGKTTWYCENCAEEHLDNIPCISPEIEEEQNGDI